LAEDDGVSSTPYLYLSSAYGDVTGEFASGNLRLGKIVKKSDGSTVFTGNQNAGIDGPATYTGGRTRILIDLSLDDVATATEVKGVLRKI
jgi:hypothetical protein